MTQRARTGYRNHRRASWAALLAVGSVAAVAALAIVLPAFAVDRFSEPTSPGGVVPTVQNVGGSNFSCTANTNGQPAGMIPFQINNPPNTQSTANYNLPSGVTLAVTGVSGQDGGKVFSFAMTGGLVFHVGVNGGTNTAEYNYVPLGGISSDGHLHATSTNQGKLNVASWTTFCYKPVVKIEGHVYRDTNGDGSTTGDSTLAGRPVTLSTGGSTTTDGSGKYTFLVPTGSSFTVCASAASGEVQTKPNDHDGTTNACTTADGYPFSNVSGDSTGNDFAFTDGQTVTCTQDGTGPYFESPLSGAGANAIDRAKFYSVDSSCKASNQQFVFTTYTDGTSRVAKLTPINTLGGTCDRTTGVGCQIVAERITWSLTGDSPELKTLKYDDTANGGSSGVMKFCVKDPFNRSAADGVTLFTGAGFRPADILPAGESSCLARTTQSGPLAAPTRVDETYTAYDGTKLVG